MEYGKVVSVIAIITLAAWFAPLSYHALGYVYLLAVIALSTRVSRWPALASAVFSGMAWDYFCVPPKLSFEGIHFDEGLLLTTYFAVALIGSQLAALRTKADRAVLLAESERMHQTLLDSVSHELMTPMSVFRSAIEQLTGADEQRRLRLIGELKIAMQRLERIVGNLLNQNRLESGVIGPRLDWCDAHEIVAAARRAVGSRLDEHLLSLSIPENLPCFRADASLMEEALAQLLLNAALHTPPRTEIEIAAALSPDRKRVLLAVTDHGPGIPEAVREAVFEKFKRGPNPKKGGLGLGLSIVRGFMRAQGGKVWVEASASGGARFTLSLPHEDTDPVPIL